MSAASNALNVSLSYAVAQAVLDGATVEPGAMVAANAVLRKGTVVPTGQLWGGNPAKFMRQMTADETAYLRKSATSYAELAAVHASEDQAAQDELANL